MDLLEHAAAVWARRWIVLAVALTVAVLVLVWRSAAPETYSASTTVQVRVPVTDDSDPSQQVTYYATQAGGRAASPEVVAAALQQAGLATDDDAVDDAADDVVTEAGDEPGFLVITASGDSADDAARLADALADVLAEAVAQDQTDDLEAKRAGIRDAIAALAEERRAQPANDKFAIAAIDREREALLGSLRTSADVTPWRLAVVDPADVPDGPDSPRPLRDALLALLVALVLAAEGVVLVRAVRGSLSARDSAGDAARVTGLPATAVPAGARAGAVAPLLAAVGGSREVAVVGLGDRTEGRTARLLSDLLAAQEDDVVLHEVSGPDSTVAAGDDDRVVLSVGVATVDDLLPYAVALAGPVVLDVDHGTTRPRLRSDVETLRALGLDVVAVAVRGGRA